MGMADLLIGYDRIRLAIISRTHAGTSLWTTRHACAYSWPEVRRARAQAGSRRAAWVPGSRTGTQGSGSKRPQGGRSHRSGKHTAEIQTLMPLVYTFYLC